MRPRAFTLVELLVTMSVAAVLAALLLPALAGGKDSAQRVKCVSNLHQFGLAEQLYWSDNAETCFTTQTIATNGGVIHWCGWLDGTKPEGKRAYDFSLGKLFSYFRESDVRLCPTLLRAVPFKFKASNTVLCSYGYNGVSLSPNAPGSPPIRAGDIKNPAGTALFGDAAQVNNFQAPASPMHPMVEEWYYIDNPTNSSGGDYYPHGHFRHRRRAVTVFCDGHVGEESCVAGSIDPKLPAQYVGRYRPEILPEP